MRRTWRGRLFARRGGARHARVVYTAHRSRVIDWLVEYGTHAITLLLASLLRQTRNIVKVFKPGLTSRALNVRLGN